MTRQKSKFWTFIFSFIPGCGQLYMGFMQRGLSLLIMFAASIALTSFTSFGAFAAFIAIIWLYSFFDAMNLASAPPEVFVGIKDEMFLFQNAQIQLKNPKKTVGICLISLGVVMVGQQIFRLVLNYVYDVYGAEVYDKIWYIENVALRVGFGLITVAAGFYIIFRKKKEADALPPAEA